MISEYDLKSPSEQLQIYAAACEREESLQDELRWARLEKAAVEFMPAVKEHRVKNNSSASAIMETLDKGVGEASYSTLISRLDGVEVLDFKPSILFLKEVGYLDLKKDICSLTDEGRRYLTKQRGEISDE